MYQSTMVTVIPPVPHKQYVLEYLVLVAVVGSRATEEADGVGDADGVEVGAWGVAK